MWSLKLKRIKSLLYLMENLPGGQLSPVFWRWLVGLLSQKKNKLKRIFTFTFHNFCMHTPVLKHDMTIFVICIRQSDETNSNMIKWPDCGWPYSKVFKVDGF